MKVVPFGPSLHDDVPRVSLAAHETNFDVVHRVVVAQGDTRWLDDEGTGSKTGDNNGESPRRHTTNEKL